MSGRRANTSCVPCRKSRIGCDAALRAPKSCTNCVRRKKCCSNPGSQRDFTETQRQRHSTTGSTTLSDNGTPRFGCLVDASGYESLSPLTSLFLPPFDVENVALRREQAVSLHYRLWDVFVSVWDKRSSLWFSNSCNPILETSIGSDSLISRIVLDIDRGAAAELDATLNNAVRYAVYAFALRWLPLRSAFESTRGVDEEKAKKMEQEVRDHLWRRAQAAMYPALSRPSYRSILALLLFSFTEAPENTSDQGFPHLCAETLSSHFCYMRSSLRRQTRWPLCDWTTIVPPTREPGESPASTGGDSSDELDHLRNAIFWLGIICDSSRSLIQQRPSIALPSMSVARVWDMIRQRNTIFDQSFRKLHGSPLPLPHDVTTVVIQHALACKTMYVGMLNEFREAAFDGTETAIEEAARRIQVESHRFHDTLDQLLGMCARDYMKMSVENQLNYTLISTHYYLGTLILADIRDELDTVPEPLQDPQLSRHFACNSIVNAVGLALNRDRYSDADIPYESLLLLDPTSITMIEALWRAAKAICLLRESGQLDAPAAKMMLSVVNTGLTVLSRVSKTASYALTLVGDLSFKTKLNINSENFYDVQALSGEEMDLLGNCDCEFIDEFLQEMQVQASRDHSLLERTIARFEKPRQTRGSPEGSYQTSIFVANG